MTQTLEQLSAAATQGEWRTAFVHWGQWRIEAQGGDGACKVNGQPITPVVPYSDALVDDLNFIVALVNAYRTGQLVEVQADDATVEWYRHKKRGTVYEVIGEAELQTNTDNLVDGSQMMVYRGDDGKLWCRHYDEFHDGRFAAMPSQAALQPDDAMVTRLETSFVVQMEAQADDTTPSSIHRDQGRVWLEGWFDLKQAIAAMKGPKP